MIELDRRVLTDLPRSIRDRRHWRRVSYGTRLSISIICVLLIKTAVFAMVFTFGHHWFGGGNDANYYNAYALGYTNVAMHSWPLVLRWLDKVGLYSRTGVTIALMFLGSVLVPLVAARVASKTKHGKNGHVYLWVILLLNLYPSLVYQELDIYRDVWMLTIFIIGVYAVWRCQDTSSFVLGTLWALCVVAISVPLYFERNYLGAAFLCAFGIYRFIEIKGVWIVVDVGIFICAMYLIYLVGGFDTLIKYNEGFYTTQVGGSNLPINYSKSLFLPEFGLSFLFQMFGLWIGGMSTAAALVAESIPFMIGCYFVVKYRKYSDPLVKFLLVFFVLYGGIWLIGNANLGTAVRIRIFNYVAILICVGRIFINRQAAVQRQLTLIAYDDNLG